MCGRVFVGLWGTSLATSAVCRSSAFTSNLPARPLWSRSASSSRKSRAPAPAEARTSALLTFSGPNDTANDALADDDVTVAPVERSELTARR
jgi:hypothetical protein